MKKSRIFLFASGAASGLVNGMLGTGGGILAVPALKSFGMDEKEAHRNSVAAILPITAVSAAIYYFSGSVYIHDALPFLIPGLAGAGIGTVLMKKIKSNTVKVIFSLFIIAAGVRMLWK